MKRIGLLLALAASLALPASAVAQPFPSHIDLPSGFAPEGIAIGRHASFYTGSLSGAGIWRGSLRTGSGHLLVEGGGPFTGIKVDARNRLWVAGGPSGMATVFKAGTGSLIASRTLATGSTFINDVIVTRHAAFFTDSFQPVLYRVPIGPRGGIGTPQAIALDPEDIGFVPGGAFNLNGIEAARHGRVLVAVNSTSGDLIRINARTGGARPIHLRGDPLVNGDGILRRGRTLWVVRNLDNVVAVVRLDPRFARARVRHLIEPADVDVPTTVARLGRALYVVNARFELTPAPDVPYWVTRISL